MQTAIVHSEFYIMFFLILVCSIQNRTAVVDCGQLADFDILQIIVCALYTLDC